MIKNTGRSSTYIGSVDNTAIGNQEIAELRLSTKIFNAEEKLKALKNPGYEPKIRKIALYARLGKNNPRAGRYKVKTGWGNPYSRIRIEDAATIDIYATDYIKRNDQWGNRWVTANF